MRRVPSQSSPKHWLIQGIKLSVAMGIIVTLVWSGRINFGRVELFFTEPQITLFALLHFFGACLFLGGLRWFVLLHSSGIHLPLVRVLRFHWVGQLFNTVLPGALGGDLVKAVYVLRQARPLSKTPTLLTVLLDRIFGMSGLFILSGIGVSLQFYAIWQNPLLKPYVIIVAALTLGVLALMILVFIPSSFAKRLWIQHLWQFLRRFPSIVNIVLALRLHNKRPSRIVWAILLSVALQAVVLAYFWSLVVTLSPHQPNFSEFMAVFPLGILVSTLPISPGGIGVGHLAFEHLLSTINIERGADIFNLYLISTIVLSLSGVLPYLMSDRPDLNFVEQVDYDKVKDSGGNET